MVRGDYRDVIAARGCAPSKFNVLAFHGTAGRVDFDRLKWLETSACKLLEEDIKSPPVHEGP